MKVKVAHPETVKCTTDDGDGIGREISSSLSSTSRIVRGEKNTRFEELIKLLLLFY